MILRIKPYAVNVKYPSGSHLVLADTLFRTYVPIEATDQPDEFELHVLGSRQLRETMLHKLTNVIEADLVLQSLQKVVTSTSG